MYSRVGLDYELMLFLFITGSKHTRFLTFFRSSRDAIDLKGEVKVTPGELEDPHLEPYDAESFDMY